MADPAFFRDLGTRFDNLKQSHDRREELHALYSETTYAHHAAECGVMARQFAMAGDDDAAYEYARQAGRAGQAALEGAAKWAAYLLSGGPSDPTARDSLQNQWSALAKMGAAAAGVAGSIENARDSWLDLLRARGAYFRFFDGSACIDGENFETPGGVIERLCTASVELCLLLESEAVLQTLHDSQPAATTERKRDRDEPPATREKPATDESGAVIPAAVAPQQLDAPATGRSDTVQAGPLQHRAAWLREQMRARGLLTRSGIQKVGGPDKKTTQKILDGWPVRPDTVLPKLAEALSQRGQPVDARDIPLD